MEPLRGSLHIVPLFHVFQSHYAAGVMDISLYFPPCKYGEICITHSIVAAWGRYNEIVSLARIRHATHNQTRLLCLENTAVRLCKFLLTDFLPRSHFKGLFLFLSISRRHTALQAFGAP